MLMLLEHPAPCCRLIYGGLGLPVSQNGKMLFHPC